jgi:ribulose-5-phosphate 4-epimerase/fuculose-1-phosphate aldolase
MPNTFGFDMQDPRGQLAAMARELYGRGAFTSLGGNLSIRVSGLDAAWITPSGVFKGGLHPEDMVRIDLKARMVGGAPGLAPSVEAAVHAAIYRSRKDVGAVIHAHPPHAIVVATLDLPIECVIDEALPYADIPRLGYFPPGSGALVDAVSEAMAGSDLVMLAHHGLFAAGPSLRAAANHLLGLESTCQVLLLMRQHAQGHLPVIP